MSNSPLVVHTNLSPNCTKPRNAKIDTITIHCMAGNCSVETCGRVFAPISRQASSNYGVGTDGRIGLYVDEANRSWCTSSGANDNRSVTIEVANDENKEPWHVSNKALAATIELVTDICKRNGIKKLLWRGDKNLIGQVDKQNMTVHRWFAAKSCPGNYLFSKHSYIADEVNKRLGASTTPVTPTPTTPAPPPTYKVGDIVEFSGGALYNSSNAAIPVHSRDKSKCKITKTYGGKHPLHLVSEDAGDVCGWVDIIDVAAGSPAGKIEVGSKVKIKAGAKYSNGGAIPAWVAADTWIVSDLTGDRAVLGKNVSGKNNINSPVNIGGLVLV